MKDRSIDRHRINYFNDYRKKIIEQVIVAYGNQCSCIHCITKICHRPLLLVCENMIDKSQYQIALYLRKNKFKKLAKIYCTSCWPTCQHDYKNL